MIHAIQLRTMLAIILVAGAVVACAHPRPPARPVAVSPAVATARAHLEGDRVERDLAAARTVLAGACEAGDAAACAMLADALGDWLGFDPPAQASRRGRACDLGHGSACAALGRRADAERAERAACTTDPAACWRLAQMLRLPDAPAATVDEARRLEATAWRQLTAACTGGDDHACRTGADLAQGGRPRVEDRAAARRLLDVGCARGDPRACARVLTVRVLRPAPPPAVIATLTRACQAGDGTACDAWANLLPAARRGPAATRACARGLDEWCGRGSPRELGLLTRACEVGHGDACERLGGRRQDVALIERACELGRAESCYQRARDADVTAELHASLLERGCVRGHATSCKFFANLLHDGHGVPADPARALAILTAHCEAVSCRMAGVWLRYGDGVPADPVRARVLLAGACRGDDRACGVLAEMMLAGEGGPRDARTAVALWQRLRARFTEICRVLPGEECVTAEELWRIPFGGLPVDRELAAELRGLCEATRSCD